MTCRGFLQCLLKFLNFLLILVGVAITLYALWMLNQWNTHHPGAVKPTYSGSQQDSVQELVWEEPRVSKYNEEKPTFNVLGLGRSLSLKVSEPHAQCCVLLKQLPAPWFIYAFFGLGVIVLLITCTGHIAAEISSACCLSCYSVCLVLLIVAQAAAVAIIFFDRQWEKNIPNDPTGEFLKIEKFIKKNLQLCKWVAVGVVVIEVLSLIMALILRPLVANVRRGYDSDDDALPPPRPSIRQPLLNRQTTQGNAPNSTPAEAHPTRTDAWSTRMRDKYGLDVSEFTYNPSEMNRFQQQNAAPVEEKKGLCAVM